MVFLSKEKKFQIVTMLNAGNKQTDRNSVRRLTEQRKIA